MVLLVRKHASGEPCCECEACCVCVYTQKRHAFCTVVLLRMQGMDDELFDCLDKWRFESGCIRVIAEEDMEATDQPIALIATLIQLRDMQVR